MYFIDKDGVRNLENGDIIEMGTEEWSNYKQWCSEGNEPKFGEPYEDNSLVSTPETEEEIVEEQPEKEIEEN